MTADDFAAEFVIESAAIESQVIPRDAVMDTHHMEAFQAALGLGLAKGSLSECDIKNWQVLIVREQHRWGDRTLSESALGEYRESPVYMTDGRGRSTEIGAPPAYVPAKMAALVSDINYIGLPGMDPLARAAWAHHTYERVHPFIDGNGRSGRLISVYVCAYYGLPQVLFTSADRFQRYYPCFEKADFQPMVRYFRDKQTVTVA